ncbi:Acidic fibroblast growth factor intracellular-binding protein [Fasciolopsis buskii]|uniref:Acidic fibroblast growth factor intracellular-binding protein n=1 Tax=Fasciolopsis buskii TaxID=27845 RepID=A0A8E0VPV0_9TREM|nr:Acidic fibroblast growth factor intracellular-binding protein [Fasciolopsis buski]
MIDDYESHVMDWPRSNVTQSMCMMDVTVTCPNLVDMEMFDYWVQGFSVAQTCSMLSTDPSVEEFSITNNMLTSHVRDHFTQFTLIEYGLRHPESFLQACAYRQLPLKTRKQLVQKYYSIDEHLLRELVGRKLSTKTRRELSEIAERCDLRVRSCKRQFDNLLCVARRTEDLPGRLVDSIKTHFLLPDWLCECYAAVVFILTNRFDVQKRSLAYITFGDLVYCAGQLMSQWTAVGRDTKGDANATVDLDLQFFHDLREVKPLAENKEYLDKHKMFVARALSDAKATHITSNLDTNFKPISKAIIAIACGLTHAKEMRDFFLDIVERLIEPMRVLGWPPNEVKLFLDAYGSAASHVPPTKTPFLNPIWTRFIIPFANCVQHLYHN